MTKELIPSEPSPPSQRHVGNPPAPQQPNTPTWRVTDQETQTAHIRPHNPHTFSGRLTTPPQYDPYRWGFEQEHLTSVIAFILVTTFMAAVFFLGTVLGP